MSHHQVASNPDPWACKSCTVSARPCHKYNWECISNNMMHKLTDDVRVWWRRRRCRGWVSDVDGGSDVELMEEARWWRKRRWRGVDGGSEVMNHWQESSDDEHLHRRAKARDWSVPPYIPSQMPQNNYFHIRNAPDVLHDLTGTWKNCNNLEIRRITI